MNCIIFDLDETLIDRHAAVMAFSDNLYNDFDIAMSADAFRSTVTRLDEYGYADRELFFASLCESTGVAMGQVRSRFYGEVWETPRLVDGAERWLETLVTANVPLGIVTNGGNEAQSAKIKHSGLSQYFGSIVISEAFGAKKPDPGIYLEALGQLGVGADGSWFVGDHPRNDVWGSKQLGLLAGWVHLERPWHDDLVPCYDVCGSQFDDVMRLIMEQFGARVIPDG